MRFAVMILLCQQPPESVDRLVQEWQMRHLSERRPSTADAQLRAEREERNERIRRLDDLIVEAALVRDALATHTYPLEKIQRLDKAWRRCSDKLPKEKAK